MVVLNYSGEEINAKIVYYGPGLSGKTTNLEYIHANMPAGTTGKMVSMKTRTDRTLFFDFLPLELGEINGYRTRFLLYTVPGQVYYNATRKLVLKGVDALVFVADSSPAKLDENIESLRNLEDNLNEHGMSLDNMPWVIQYNKRDLPDATPLSDLHRNLNLLGVPAFEGTATAGTGVYDTLQGAVALLYKDLKVRLEQGEVVSHPEEAAPQPKSPDEVSDVVDSALREIGKGGEAQKHPEASPVPAPPHAVPRATPVPLPVTDPSADAAPPTVPASGVAAPHERQPDDVPAAASNQFDIQPGLADPVQESGAPTRVTETESYPFESIPVESSRADLGRVPNLDAVATESGPPPRQEEFITDPMRRSSPPAADRGSDTTTATVVAPEPTAAPVAERRPEPSPVPSTEDVVPKPVKPKPVKPKPVEPKPVEPEVKADPPAEPLKVPVVIPRSRLQGSSPLKIVLEIEVID